MAGSSALAFVVFSKFGAGLSPARSLGTSVLDRGGGGLAGRIRISNGGYAGYSFGRSASGGLVGGGTDAVAERE